jgi:hypothetical protein
MNNYNDEDEFDTSDFEQSELADMQAIQEIKQEDERIRNLPLMMKSKQILQLVDSLVETIPDDDMAEQCKRVMLDDALTMVTKIAGAESGDLYTLRMENAVFVKLAARNLLTQLSGLSLLGMIEPRYMELLKAEIEEFRLLFIDWMETFDKSKDIPDNWGLFNCQ